MKNTFVITNAGLQEKPIDLRDMPLGGVFGYIDISEVPNTDFIVANPLSIKDQGDTDYCSAYAVTAVSEDQEGIELSPEYQFFSTKRITGNKEEWGADLRSAMKSAVKYGSVPAHLFQDMKDKPRSFILEESSWGNADFVARPYKKDTYFEVDGKYDVFDNIRCALWQHREEKNTIVTGASWRGHWITAENGIILDGNGDGFGHAFKIFGQKFINGELFLVAQLSGGKEVGDGGIYYFNREIANKEFGRFGHFMFKDMTREMAEFYLSQPFTVKTPLWKKVLLMIINIFKK